MFEGLKIFVEAKSEELKNRGLGLAHSLLWVSSVAAAYTALAFLWSGIGLLSPTTPIHFHEYSFPALLTEIGGHFLFGLAAGLITLDSALILLCGAESILIDADHLLTVLNFPVETRLAHSVAFAILAALALSYSTRGGARLNRKVLFVTISAAAAHLSYDVFAGNGLVPILAPFNLSLFTLPFWTWPLLEFLAVATNVLPRFLRKRDPPIPKAILVYFLAASIRPGGQENLPVSCPPKGLDTVLDTQAG